MKDEEIKEYWRTAYFNEKHKKEELAEEYAKLNARQYKRNDNTGFCTSEDEVEKAFLAGYTKCLVTEAKTLLDEWCRGDDPCPHLKKRDEQLTKAKDVIRDLYFVIQDRIDYTNNIPLIDTMARAIAILK